MRVDEADRLPGTWTMGGAIHLAFMIEPGCLRGREQLSHLIVVGAAHRSAGAEDEEDEVEDAHLVLSTRRNGESACL